MTMLRLYAEEGHFSRVPADHLFESGKNWFIGWKCLAGTRSLTIDHEGNIFSAHCKSMGSYGRQGSYGNVFTEFHLEKSPINCARRFCETEFDLSIPKYQKPKYTEILSSENFLQSDLDKPVAIQGDQVSLRKIHWNVSAFGLTPVSHWKNAVHRLELFFKGEMGRIILQDPPVQNADFFTFIEFLKIEKGHEVTVEGNFLASPSFFERAISHADLILRYDGEEKSFFDHLRALGERRINTRTVTVSLDIKNPEYKRLKSSLSDFSWVTPGFYLGKVILPLISTTHPEVSAPVRNTKAGIRTLLFIPMRNCGNTIGAVISGLDEKLLKHVSEILILDNDSTDNSMKAASEAAKSIQGVKVIIRKNEKNYGFGGSHKLAFQYAHLQKMDYMMVVHGDNSGSPSQFLPLFESREFLYYDLVLSSRVSLSSKRTNYPIYRLLANWVLSLLASLMTNSLVSDFSGGPVGLFRVQTFINKYENPVKKFSDLISFTQDAFLFVSYKRGSVRFVPIQFREAGGKSFYSATTQFVQSVMKILSYRFR